MVCLISLRLFAYLISSLFLHFYKTNVLYRSTFFLEYRRLPNTLTIAYSVTQPTYENNRAHQLYKCLKVKLLFRCLIVHISTHWNMSRYDWALISQLGIVCFQKVLRKPRWCEERRLHSQNVPRRAFVEFLNPIRPN